MLGNVEGAALDLINKTDRRRATYYGFYTGGKWGKYDNYHLAIDSRVLGIEGTAALIAEAAEKRGKKDRWLLHSRALCDII